MEVSLIDNIGSPHDNIDPRVRCQHLLPHARLSKPEVVAGPGEDQPRVPGARARQVPGRCGLPLRVCDRAAAGDQGRVQEVREGPGPEGGIRRVRVSRRKGRVCLHQVRHVFHCLTHPAYIMFYRDDRMVETEHLGLCEVIVTPTPGETGDTLHIPLFILSMSTTFIHSRSSKKGQSLMNFILFSGFIIAEPHSCGVPEGPVRGSVAVVVSGIVHFIHHNRDQILCH